MIKELGDSSESDDYGLEIIDKVEKTATQVNDERKNKNIVKRLMNAGQNDHIQAILQPLMAHDSFVDYFLLKTYSTEERKLAEQPMCELMTNLCQAYFALDLANLASDRKVDISFLENYIDKVDKDYEKEENHPALEFFELLWRSIKTEIGFTRKNWDHQLYRLMFIEMEQLITCSKGHERVF